MKIIIICLLLCSCVNKAKRPIEAEDSIGKLLAEDKEYKLIELSYLNEIKIAEENNDSDAFDFFLKEYFAVPRLDIDEYLKQDERYFWGGRQIKY